MSYDQLAQSQEANTFEVEFEPRAYSKMILHAAKYPHCAVSGLLLASGGRKSTGQIVLTDCIPLFHQSEGELLSIIYFRDLLALLSNTLITGISTKIVRKLAQKNVPVPKE